MNKILYVKGIPDNKLVRYISSGMIDTFGSSNLYNFIDLDKFEKELLIIDANDKTSVSSSLDCKLLVNQISDPDTHLISLNKTLQIINHFKFKVYNNPEFILNTYRDKVYELVKNLDGIYIPKTIAINPNSPNDIKSMVFKNKFEYPYIIRKAGNHGGIDTFKIENENEIDNLYSLSLNGSKYYVTQFIDFKSKNKLYIKFRLVVIDSKVYIRHAIISNDWMIHSNSREEEFCEMEENILNKFESKIKPNISSKIKLISEKIKLNYFGIDCSIDENYNILIFEINANMNILVKSNNFTDKYVDIIRERLKISLLKRI